ncbi:MAG: hypothetical protein JWP87_5469 [Labilithrix sp.]|nr:hypothetical protein [Labilithrix sp.]
MASSRNVALLRGINVGGNNKLPMKELVAMFERAGCTHVRNYIQSGNIVFDAPPARAKRIPQVIQAEIERKLGLRVPVIVRSEAELRAIAKRHPLFALGAEPDKLLVMFLAGEPGKKEQAALDPNRSPPDTFVVKGREIYVSCPNGMGRSKLTNAWFDAKLATTSTGRNWRTVLKLVEMCDEEPS